MKQRLFCLLAALLLAIGVSYGQNSLNVLLKDGAAERAVADFVWVL